MALGITADHAAFRAAVADVDAAVERLRDDRDRVSREVATLLDGGWRGPAAVAYASGWAQWLRGADRVLDALAWMGRTLQSADAELLDTDHGCGAGLARIAARLG